MTTITKEWLEEQVIKLSDERDKAKLHLAEASIEFDRAKKQRKEALDTLDSLDVLIAEFQFQLGIDKCQKK